MHDIRFIEPIDCCFQYLNDKHNYSTTILWYLDKCKTKTGVESILAGLRIAGIGRVSFSLLFKNARVGKF